MTAPVGRTHTGEIHGGLSPVGSTPGRSRGRLWGVLPLRRKEHRAETGQTNHSSHLLSPCAAGGEKVEKLGVKLSPRFYFISHYPSLNCTNFPKSVVLTIATGEWCLPVLIPTHNLFSIFSLPYPADKVALEGIWHPARVDPAHYTSELLDQATTPETVFHF